MKKSIKKSLHGLLLGIVYLMGILGIVASGGGSGGSNGTDPIDTCTRLTGNETTYYYPHTGRTNASVFQVQSRNSDGTWFTGERKYDAYNDGTINTSTKYIYLSRDLSGNLITYKTEWDDLANGTVDEVAYNTYTRNSQGHPLVENREIDTDMDGIYDSNFKFYYVQDSGGHNLREKNELDHNYDGVIDEKYTFDYTYDSEGRFLSAIRSHDSDNDGVVDSASTLYFSYKYNDQGEEVEREIRIDEDQNGSVDKIETRTYTEPPRVCRRLYFLRG